MDDRIQSCIEHIKTAVDVDPWAAELAEKALRLYGEHTCKSCKWRSDAFTSACTNGESERRADFVSADDTCEHWEGKTDG